MIGLDVSPLDGPPCGVRRMVEGWLEGIAALPGAPEVVRLVGRTRTRLARGARAAGVSVFLSPWQAFPALDVPVVATVHELAWRRHGPIEGRLRTLAYRHWLARDVRETAAIVVPSVATRDDVLDVHPDAASKVHVVPHAFDPSPWRAAADRRTGPAPAPPIVIAVGASSRRKGLDVLAEAARLVRDVQWVVVGSPPRDVARRLVAAGVEVRRDLPDADLRACVAGASVLVHPSRSEGFGFPPLEAMAAGVPVVAARAGSVPEVVEDAALLVPPGDASALAHGVERVLSDAGLRARLVEAGRGRADAFPAHATAKRLLDVLARAEDARR